MKRFKYLAASLFASVLTLTSCSDDKSSSGDNPTPPTPPSNDVVYVLNQGAYFSQIDGSLDRIDLTDSRVVRNVFFTANQRSLGNTPQCAWWGADKMYIGVTESNTIEVVNPDNGVCIKQLSLIDNQGKQPRSMAFKSPYLYISMYNGYVTRYDVNSQTIVDNVQVGPNPEVIAIRDNYLYVPNSDGLNYPNYGTTASKIDLNTFQVVATIPAGLNPGAFVSDGNYLYLLSKGNYADVPSKVYRVNADDSLTELAEATYIAAADGKLYYILAPFYGPATYNVMDMATGTVTDMLKDSGVDSPAAIAVIDGHIFISSYSLDNGYTSYSTDGYVKVYELDGTYKASFTVGVGPGCIFGKN